MEQNQNRFKSWALWVAVAGAIWTALSIFGVTEKIGIGETEFKKLVDCIGEILILFGICNNPTDKSSF